MGVTVDDLLAFQAAKLHGGLRSAETAMKVRRSALIERRNSLAASLNKALFTGTGRACRLTANGQTLDVWITSFPGGLKLAAYELNTRGWDAVEPTSAKTDPHDDLDASGEPSSTRPTMPSATGSSRSTLIVELPEHPVLAELVRTAILPLPVVIGTFQTAKGGPWHSAVERLVTGDIDIAFGWSPGDKPDGYPPTLKAQRLMADNFDHAIERRGFWHRVWPSSTRLRTALLLKLRKRPVAMLGRSAQTSLDEHFQWLAGKLMIVMDPPSDEHGRNAWKLASRFSDVVCPGQMIRPLDVFGLRAGFDVVYRADEEQAGALALIDSTVARFGEDTGIDPSPVRSMFISSPSAQDLAKAKADRAHLLARRKRWKP